MRQAIVYAVVLVGLLVNPLVSFSQNMEVPVEKNNPYPMSDVKWEKLMKDNEKIIKLYGGRKLYELPEKDRNEYLIALARRCVLVYGPAYYRDYKHPIIEEGVFPPLPSEGKKERWPHAEQPYYEVLFPYDTSKELFYFAFIARVAIVKEDASIATVEINSESFLFPSKEREEKRRISYLEDRSQCVSYSSILSTNTEVREKVLRKILPELEKYQLLK